MSAHVVRAAGYIRVSTAEQALRGLSLEAQEAEIRRWAAEHHVRLENIYVDKGITARKQLHRRAAFMQMMQAVDAGQIDLILVMRLDRWFRNVYDYHKMMNEHLIPHGVNWCAVKEDYDTTTTNGRLMINLRLSIAEQECDTDADRIRDVQQNMVAKGRWPFGAAPLGYRIEEKRLVKDPHTQPQVEFFFRHMLANGSLRGALFAMNDRFGTSYEYRRAQDLSRKSVYYGVYGENQSFCPAYITLEEHQRIRSLAEKNVRVWSSPTAWPHLFSGLLICDDCHRRLNAQTIRRPSGVYTTYRCSHSTDNHGCANNRSISEKVIEEYLLNYVREDLAQYIVQMEVSQKKAAALPDNTAKIRAKQERVKTLFINNFIDLEEYKRRIQELEGQIIRRPPPEKTKDVSKLKQLLEDGALKMYPTLTREEKRAFWRGFLKELHIYRGTIQGPPIFL